MRNLPGNSHVFDLWIVKNFRNPVDWRIGNMMCVEPGQPMLAFFRSKLLAENFDDFFVAISARFAVGKADVANQMVEITRLEQSFPGLVVTGKVNHEGFPIAIEQAVDPAFWKVL